MRTNLLIATLVLSMAGLTACSKEENKTVDQANQAAATQQQLNTPSQPEQTTDNSAYTNQPQTMAADDMSQPAVGSETAPVVNDNSNMALSPTPEANTTDTMNNAAPATGTDNTNSNNPPLPLESNPDNATPPAAGTDTNSNNAAPAPADNVPTTTMPSNN